MNKTGYKNIYDSILFVQRSLEADKKEQIKTNSCVSTVDKQVYLDEPENNKVNSFVTQLIDYGDYYLEKKGKDLELITELLTKYNTPMGPTQIYTNSNELPTRLCSVCDYLSLKHYSINRHNKYVQKNNVLFRAICKLLDYVTIFNMANQKFKKNFIPVTHIKNSVTKSIYDMINLKSRIENSENGFKQTHSEWANVTSNYYTNLYLVNCCISLLSYVKQSSINNTSDFFPFVTTLQDFYKQIDVSYNDMCKNVLSGVNTCNRIDRVNYGYDNLELTIIDFICGGNANAYDSLPTQDSKILKAFNTEMKKYFAYSVYLVPNEITDNGKNLYKYKFGFTNEDMGIIAKQTLFYNNHISPFANNMLTQLAGKMLLTRKFIAKASKSQDLDKTELIKIFQKLQTGFVQLFTKYLQCVDAVCFFYCSQYLNKLAHTKQYSGQKFEPLQERNKLQKMFIVFRKIISGLDISKQEFENCFKSECFDFETVYNKDINIFKIRDREEIYNEYYKSYVKSTAPVNFLVNACLLFFSSFSIYYSLFVSFAIVVIDFLVNRISIKENLNIFDIFNICFNSLKFNAERIILTFSNNNNK